ncbi:MAG TPA: cyclic nucleotide-binding domain-containing protein [Waterburya sp.]|jgi:small-conductance mechanosensitive channel/CRP-like cAMP-binding protein
MNIVIDKLSKKAFYIFTTQLFQLGETSISLSTLVQLIILLILVLFVSRAIKQLFKRKLLLQLGIDEGNREAIATITSYTIGILGIIIVLQTTGLNLASLAVLAGGLGVGIGFGLQDVTKNFVSGLTLLLERKLKVGDFIEFDGLVGYVKEIAIRSTIIRTREGGDVIVPNSQLVGNRLLNWTYDSFTARIHIPVGVSESSDPLIVTETLLKSAYMEPFVLYNPPPKVLFKGFGDSSLDFELRVWVNRIDQEPDIRSSLNFIIEYNLRQQGINIPLPQRALWLQNPEVLTPLFSQQEVKPSTEPLQQQPPINPSKGLTLRDLLRQVSYFHNFTDLELRRLIEIGYRKRLKGAEILFREDDSGDAFYIILSGSVEVFVEKLNKHLTILHPGQFLGELSLMLGSPRTATVRALEDTILFVINRKGFEILLQEHPELAEVIVQELGKHQDELSERQQQLRKMGLVDATEDDKNPVAWVRKRLKNLFSL